MTAAGTEWVKQKTIPQDQVDELLERLCANKEAAATETRPQPVKLTYKHDPSKGGGKKAFAEVYVPVKKVQP